MKGYTSAKGTYKKQLCSAITFYLINSSFHEQHEKFKLTLLSNLMSVFFFLVCFNLFTAMSTVIGYLMPKLK